MESFFSKQVFDNIKSFIDSSQNILVLSHLDADGLSSAGIMTQLLQSMNKEFTVRILKQLENDDELKNKNHDLIIITDMGSGQFNIIKENVEEKKFIIIDHHQAQNSFEHKNLIHFNPEISDDSYSGSGLCFLVAKTLNPEFEKIIHLGLVGAIGDMQYNNGFLGFNNEMLNLGVINGRLDINKGLNVFGRVSKPLHQILAYSYNLNIPGITGNESAAVQFLSKIGIRLKDEELNWRTLSSLNEEETKILVSNIIIKRVAQKMDSNILGDVITINGETGLLSDLREWSVLLNACGRQGIYSLGILLCSGYEGYALPLIEEVIKEYRKMLMEAINLIKTDKSLTQIDEDLLIINGKEMIRDTIIGTVGGMVLKNNDFNVNTFLGFAERLNSDEVKVSCRTKTEFLNVGNILKNVCEKLECLGGGHKVAGGAVISKSKKDDFLDLFKKEMRETLINT